MQNPRPFVIFLSGPTASGKTGLSFKLAEEFPVEIVNADMGQFYAPFSIGTAKPDWQNQIVPHHLFDILNKPVDCNVKEYRRLLLKTIEEVSGRGKIPLVVGGSLFYLKSLFYPPLDSVSKKKHGETLCVENDVDLWTKLKDIDPVRAEKLHPNDLYRIKRALAIWNDTGRRPSECESKFEVTFDFLFVFLEPEREALFDRINKRTVEMFSKSGSSSWIDEVKLLVGTEWQNFICRKKLIGYPGILEWIEHGEEKETLPGLFDRIQIDTRKYAKRQIAFWKQFGKILEKECSQSSLNCRILTINNPSDGAIEMINNRIHELCSYRKKEQE